VIDNLPGAAVIVYVGKIAELICISTRWWAPPAASSSGWNLV
jgi:hypothetical protein